MSSNTIQLTQNHGGPLHYLGNRYLTLPDLTGHMAPDNSWLNEHFSVLLANNKGGKYKKAIEPFAGSASWSMAAMEVGIAEEYLINDSNKILINTLQLIQNNPELIKDSYAALIKKYELSLSKKDYFLDVIEKYNRGTDEEKALLLSFIINHSWGGILFYDQELNIIYREGELFEGKRADRFLEKANLSLDMFLSEVDRVSKLFNINQVSFNSGDFMDVISVAAPGDFVALNPPYPENEHVTLDKAGMYIELYSPEQLHHNLVQIIQYFERQGIHYYMTYGFYNPKFKEYVLHDDQQQPNNYFRVLGYKHCAFGIGLDQMYFTSQFAIPEGIKIFKATEILRNQNLTPEEALEQLTN